MKHRWGDQEFLVQMGRVVHIGGGVYKREGVNTAFNCMPFMDFVEECSLLSKSFIEDAYFPFDSF